MLQLRLLRNSLHPLFGNLFGGSAQRFPVAATVLLQTIVNMTAKVYTDVPALGLEVEMAKLPWIEAGEAVAHCGAHKSDVPSPSLSLDGIMALFIEAVKVSDPEEVRRAMASAVTSCHADQNAARAGIEPATK